MSTQHNSTFQLIPTLFSDDDGFLLGTEFAGALTPSERKMEAKTHHDLVLMQRQVQKGREAIAGIAHLHRTGANEFIKTARQQSALLEQAQGTEYQALMAEYNHHSRQLQVQQTWGVLDAVARSLAQTAIRTVEADSAEEPDQRGMFGFLRRK